MKTSNKLLLSFAAFLILLMLLSDVVMWANLKNGTENTLMKGEPEVAPTALKPFKVLKVESDGQYTLQVSRSDKYEYLEDNSNNSYLQTGDTFYIRLSSSQNARVHCPQVNHILVAGSNIFLDGLQQPQLVVDAGQGSEIRLSGVQLGALVMNGGEESTVDIYDNCKVDSLTMALGRHSIFRSFDVSYQYSDLKLDSLKELQLSGRSLAGMKQIR